MYVHISAGSKCHTSISDLPWDTSCGMTSRKMSFYRSFTLPVVGIAPLEAFNHHSGTKRSMKRPQCDLQLLGAYQSSVE